MRVRQRIIVRQIIDCKEKSDTNLRDFENLKR